MDTTRFKQLAPRMMRELMRDFAPLADFQAAGAVGNGGGESGGFTIPQELHPTSGRGGLGGFQWTGPRRVQYEEYISGHGGDPTTDSLSYEMMYGMLKHELEGPEKATILALRQTRDISEATKMFMIKFERPGVPHYEGRVKWAQMALDAYRAEEGKIAKNPDIQVAKEPAKLPMPPAIPKTEADTKGAAKTVGAAGGILGGVYAFATSWMFIATIVVLGLAAVWWFLVRPVAIRYTALGDIEATFFSKIRTALKGIKTKLFASVLTISGIALPLISYASDDSNLLDKLPTIKGIPGSVYGLGVLGLIGWAMNALRNVSNTQAGQTDLALLTPETEKIDPVLIPPTVSMQQPAVIPIGANNLKAFNEVRLSHTKKRKARTKKTVAG